MLKRILLIMTLLTITYSCDIKQTKKAKLPDVEVETKEGQMPEFDVNWADINIGTTTKKMKVPKVVVVMEEEEFDVPVIDVNMPNAGNKEERTLTIETEVSGTEHSLDIKKVYASNKNLYVIAELKDKGNSLGDKTIRVSDQLVLNAPEDLNVKYYIIGEKPNRSFNSKYKYIANEARLKSKLSNKSKVIYSK